MTDAANIPGITNDGSVFALVGGNAPVWKKIIRIDMTENGPVSTVVQDYKVQDSVAKLVADAMATLEIADGDDAPEQQQYLMAAWQALAMYLASCDDEDKESAAIALKQVSAMMSDGGTTGAGPFPDGTFGRTTQTAAKAAPKKADKPDAEVKKDKNGKPLPPWMQPKAKKKTEKASTTFDCAMDDRSFSTMGGLISHLQSVHQMSAGEAKAKAGAQ